MPVDAGRFGGDELVVVRRFFGQAAGDHLFGPAVASAMYASKTSAPTRHWPRPPIWMAGSSPERTRA
ncbi:hypothetical protein D477_006688 [Arthrobacter crystallopoietes BAB-32]|uniref:Uncharacterized protein n=1 Tax=Arthrobacter crystallopoietes BAB-32 TaxID=1246476 RepID=N1V0Z0_9MICC|nr:hypothetical protein D477_006688 [Arthrobacter crystallopoietes BAB-32]